MQGNDEEEREKRIRKMRFEQEEMILKSDIAKMRRDIESAHMEDRILRKKQEDVRAQIEEAERIVKKREQELRLKEEEYTALKKKMQIERN